MPLPRHHMSPHGALREATAPGLSPEIAAKRWFLVSAGHFVSALTPDNRSLVLGRDHDPLEDAFTTQEAVARGTDPHYVWLPETYYEGVQVLVDLKASGATAMPVDILPWLDTLPLGDVEALRSDPFKLYEPEPDIIAALHRNGDSSLLHLLQNIPFEQAAPHIGIRIADLDLTQKGLDDYIAWRPVWEEPSGRLDPAAHEPEAPGL